MLWTLLAIVVAGLGAAGIALLLRKLTRNKLPKCIRVEYLPSMEADYHL